MGAKERIPAIRDIMRTVMLLLAVFVIAIHALPHPDDLVEEIPEATFVEEAVTADVEAASTDEEAAFVEDAAGQCKGDCPNLKHGAKPWSQKCAWKICNGCPECPAPTPAPTAPAPTLASRCSNCHKVSNVISKTYSRLSGPTSERGLCRQYDEYSRQSLNGQSFKPSYFRSTPHVPMSASCASRGCSVQLTNEEAKAKGLDTNSIYTGYTTWFKCPAPTPPPPHRTAPPTPPPFWRTSGYQCGKTASPSGDVYSCVPTGGSKSYSDCRKSCSRWGPTGSPPKLCERDRCNKRQDKSWAKKCTWRYCNGCDECGVL